MSLSPEADLREVVERLAEPSEADAQDHISFREARKLVAQAVRAVRELSPIEHAHYKDHGPGERERAKQAIDLTLLDLERGASFRH